MLTRRKFLMMSAGAGILLSVPVLARTGVQPAQAATAITQVFGDGIRLTAIAVEYPTEVSAEGLNPADFHVEGRTVTGVWTSTSTNPADKAPSGRYMIIALSPDDKNATLAEQVQPNSKNNSNKSASGKGGPGNAGDIPAYDTVYRTAQATVLRLPSVHTASGDTLPASEKALTTQHVENLIVDDFQQLEFYDKKTGNKLKYNLFIPKDYSPDKAWPLVLFMHDAGATSDITRTTLYQGLGAIAWASPEDQAQRPCFVLAPQYEEIIADDDSKTSDMLDTTIDLINALSEQYNIDKSRIYATGQSGGCMMTIAMNIKYPDFFAASFLVAGQWDPTLVKPLAQQKLWILVSQDDNKAWPGQNAIIDVLEKEGAQISRAIWDGTWDEEQFRQAFEQIDAEKSPINYVVFREGTVIPEGQSTEGASGHRNTWRIAYTISPIREWIFRQQR
ncbi:peptidase [Yersinia pseudotuberculosis]|uniref:Poly(3-hydroxybutyrate) depolymerase n=1 Tax=Yersinia pseudotuberculosis TaxID=633 RepID=A0A0T9JH58_YERPU|nr:prolyl oligopeptidase family serine peptidase [Yersinia pseudotuberculosis]PSH14694.1 peptidase [Yersinia pseudotuberculosis]CNC66488.1 Poly(3-hydroxybutyrate) depolymerase [Yersinia pseudotuberculosis]SUP81000.1 Poly(3-hydroxybutyrate) depolymerase [Yersinia pseudotuberculosis]